MQKEISISSRANIIIWLFSGCFLIFSMVVVGGITRLTGSGLSITEWKVVTGVIPPLNEQHWMQEFAKYQQSPQYKLINSNFSLNDFKQIYWWEFIHRLIGRLIGVVFLIPFLWFLFRKQLDRSLIIKCLILFGMGGLQGFIGWYMVSSGLVDMPSVSHFRLALHLLTAFITFGLTFWFAVELIHTKKIKPQDWQKKLTTLAVITFLMVILQIIYGAFVAGMKAGHIYNSWPKMGNEWIPEGVIFAFKNLGFYGLIDNMAGVQFIHRYIAWLVVLLVAGIWIVAKKMDGKSGIYLTKGQWQAIYLLMVVVLFQFVLGVLTIVFNVPILLGVLHQMGAFFLFTAMIYLLHRMHRSAASEVLPS